MTKERVTQLTYENEASHLGSSWGVYEVLKEIDKTRQPEDYVVVDEAHGAMGYYVWMEEHGMGNAQEMYDKHGTHQNKDPEYEIRVSGGSLGLAASVGLGMAMADKTRDVYCVTSDGSLAEGIWWEILRVKADLNVDNFKVYVNANGFGAYDPINTEKLQERVHTFCPDVVFVNTQVEGLVDHYRKVEEEEYRLLFGDERTTTRDNTKE